MDDYDTKEKGNFQARNKGRSKFVIREILAHEHVKQIYSEPEDQGCKWMLLLYTTAEKNTRLAAAYFINNGEL